MEGAFERPVSIRGCTSKQSACLYERGKLWNHNSFEDAMETCGSHSFAGLTWSRSIFCELLSLLACQSHTETCC